MGTISGFQEGSRWPVVSQGGTKVKGGNFKAFLQTTYQFH